MPLSLKDLQTRAVLERSRRPQHRLLADPDLVKALAALPVVVAPAAALAASPAEPPAPPFAADGGTGWLRERPSAQRALPPLDAPFYAAPSLPPAAAAAQVLAPMPAPEPLPPTQATPAQALTPRPARPEHPAPGALDTRLIDILRDFGVRETHISAAVQRAALTNETLVGILRDSDYGFLSGEQIAQVEARRSEHDYFHPGAIDTVPVAALRGSGLNLARFDGFVPVGLEGGRVVVAVASLEDSVRAYNAFPDHEKRFVIASERTIQTLYRRSFADTERAFDQAYAALVAHLRSGRADIEDEAAPGLLRELLMRLLRHCCYLGASDFNLHPMRSGSGAVIRVKVDGAGEIFRFVEWPVYVRLVNTLINDNGAAERLARGPVEGTVLFQGDEARRNEDVAARYQFRLELIRMKSRDDGALVTATVRILDQQSDTAELAFVGFDDPTLERLRRLLRLNHGLVIISGPTGSGKTTTLYALLKEVDGVDRWVQSIEHPIEYERGQWMQYEVPRGEREAAGSAELLKGLLRNAPNVILLGEIRDETIARLAIEAANTGHLVLTTLHNNNAALALTRLRNFGVDMAGLASILRAVVAQRLVRLLCPHCRVRDDRSDTAREFADEFWEDRPLQLYRQGAGCPHCKHRGSRGRALVYELLEVKAKVRQGIESGRPPSEVAGDGIDPQHSLRANALRLVAEGRVAIEEVWAIGGAD